MWKKTPHKIVPQIKTCAGQADRLDAGSDQLMAASGRRIMLVDNDPDACYLLSMILKLNDFDVAPFTDPEMALASFGKDQYDLLLIDVGIPEMGGFELYKKLRNIDKLAKVCFMTNYREECLQAFTESFPELEPGNLVDKPASGSALLEILNTHLIS